MIPLLSREEVRALDADAVARLGVPSSILMENAGRGAFEEIARRYPDKLTRTLIVGGVGQNGGDAWVIARHMFLRGHRPRCLLLGERAKVRGDAAPNLQAIETLIGPVTCLDEQDLGPLDAALADSALIVDGIFGTGLDRPVQGLAASVIDCNASGTRARSVAACSSGSTHSRNSSSLDDSRSSRRAVSRSPPRIAASACTRATAPGGFPVCGGSGRSSATSTYARHSSAPAFRGCKRMACSRTGLAAL